MRSIDEIHQRIAELDSILYDEDMCDSDEYHDEGQQAELQALIWVLDRHYDEDLVISKISALKNEGW